MRIRPSVTAGVPRWDAENCIHATSKHSIAIAPPEGSQAYKSGDRGQTYSFSRVFDEHTAQEEYYGATAAPLVGRGGGGLSGVVLPRALGAGGAHVGAARRCRCPEHAAKPPPPRSPPRPSPALPRCATCCATRGTTA